VRPDRVDRLSLGPDGQRLLLLNYVPICPPSRPRCEQYGFTGATVGWSGGHPTPRPSALRSVDWLSPRTLIGVSAYDRGSLLTLPLSGCCGRFFLRQSEWHFNSIAVSPDGKTVAAAAVRRIGSESAILLIVRKKRNFDVLVKSTSAVYDHPAWSPDGRWLVFSNFGQGSLFVAPAVRAAHITKLPVVGSEPTWGASR